MPQFSYRDVIKRLKKCDFYLHRQGVGSHEIWKNQEGIRLIIPNHKVIPNGTVHQIAKDAGFKNLKAFEQFK